MKEILNDILSTVKGLRDNFPNMDVDTIEFAIDTCDEDVVIYSITSEFIIPKNGIIADLDVYVSKDCNKRLCKITVQDYFTPIDDAFERPGLTSYLNSLTNYPNDEYRDSHHYISKIVPIEQMKDAYIGLLKTIQNYISEKIVIE